MSLIGLQTAFKSWRFWPKTWRFYTVQEKFLAQNMALSADFLALRPSENLVTLVKLPRTFLDFFFKFPFVKNSINLLN